MADFDINAVSGRSGAYTTKQVFSGFVSSGSSGDLVTITPSVSGRRIRLEMLSSDSTAETSVEVVLDGEVVNQGVGALLWVGSTSPSGFYVSQSGSLVDKTSSIIMQDIVGKEVVIRKVTGTTSSDIRYHYSEGY